MRNTAKLLFVLTQIALLSPHPANAQALGEIEVDSHLNQSLNARISVTSAEADELDGARIGLASEADFEKAGIERRAVLNGIQFKLVKGIDGGHSIELTTQESIKEPLLDFIVEVALPNGRLIREYSVMLDPPAAGHETAAPTKTSLMGAPHESAMNSDTAPQQMAVSPAPSPAIPARSIEPKLTDDGYGPIMRPNTLWDIAEAMHPDPSASTSTGDVGDSEGKP